MEIEALTLVQLQTHHELFSCIFPALMPTFYDRFVECAERWPKNLAVEVQRPDGIESHSYAELRGMAESVAAWLLAGASPFSPTTIRVG